MKSLDSKLTIPMDMATEFMTQIAKLEGYGEEDAGKLANQQVKGPAAMGQMFRITKVEDNTISTSLQYANGRDAQRRQNAAGRVCRYVWYADAGHA